MVLSFSLYQFTRTDINDFQEFVVNGPGAAATTVPHASVNPAALDAPVDTLTDRRMIDNSPGPQRFASIPRQVVAMLATPFPSAWADLTTKPPVVI